MKNKTEINKAIDNLSLPFGCDREPIRKLVEVITGVDLSRTYRIGHKFTLYHPELAGARPCILAAGGDFVLAVIDTDNGTRHGEAVYCPAWRITQAVFDKALGSFRAEGRVIE